MGGTRFELVTSSVSGRSAGCLGESLNARESTSPGRILPQDARGCLQYCGEWLPRWLPPWPWLPRGGTVDARIPPLGHDTTSITATAARSGLPKNPRVWRRAGNGRDTAPSAIPTCRRRSASCPATGRGQAVCHHRVIGCMTAAPCQRRAASPLPTTETATISLSRRAGHPAGLPACSTGR